MIASPHPALSRPVLRDPELERELSTRGWTTVPLLDADEARSLRDFYVDRAERGDLNPPGAYDATYAEFTIMNSANDFRRAAYERITEVVQPRVERLVDRYEPIIANFVNKPPGSGVVPVHQNISVADESVRRSVSVWIALVDCDAANGTLELVANSHLAFRGRRGVWAYEQFAEVSDVVIDRYATAVPVRCGDAIILDDAAIHCSAPNRSDRRRLSIQYVMHPAESRPRYHELVDASDGFYEVDELTVDPAYFWDFWNGIGDRRHAEVLAHHRIARSPVSVEALQSGLDAARGPRAPA